MPSSQGRSKDDLNSLLELTQASSSMITQYLNNTTPTTNARPSATMADPPKPLHVLKDAALLLKSHTTKLGLLLLNPPFTPSAVGPVVREMTTSCVPAILSAVELAHPDVWGKLLRSEVDARAAAALRAVEACLTDVRAIADGNGKNSTRRDTLASTGAVWEACDALIELEELDVGGVALQRAKQYQALIKDALGELKEWRDESMKEEDDDEDEDEVEQNQEEDIFGAIGNLPRDRPELLLALDDALAKIRRVEILYTALSKRRVAKFTKAEARIHVHVQTMDKLLSGLQSMSEHTDELAGAFYSLDEEAIEENKKELVEEARRTIKLVDRSWDGGEDEFTSWSGKWLEVMN